MHSLIEKYNYEVPRYTSYPVITQWQDQLDATSWASQVVQQLAGHSRLLLYLHLPFCESLCTYCGCNKHITTNHQVEEPYLEAILKEWQMYTSLLGEKPTISELHLGGGTPTFFSPSNLKTLIEGLFSEGVKRSEEAAFSFEAHPSSTTEDHLTTLSKLGFGRISIGVAAQFEPGSRYRILGKVISRRRKIGRQKNFVRWFVFFAGKNQQDR